MRFFVTDTPDQHPFGRPDAEAILEAWGFGEENYQDKEDWEIFTWLEEMGYEWAGDGWRRVD